MFNAVANTGPRFLSVTLNWRALATRDTDD